MLKNDRLKERWLYEQNKTLPVEYELLERAANTLVSHIESGEDLPWEPYQCITPGGPLAFRGIWNWDTAFHAMAVSRWDTELAKDCIIGFMKFQKEDGMLPDVIWIEGGIEDRLSKPPVMPWAVEIVYRRCNDKDFIKKLYPMFEKNEQWWCKNRCSEGLFYYSATADEKEEDFERLSGFESGWDNSVRWDFAKVSELWAIDLNCYMIMLYRSMKFFAEELELTEDAKKWNRKEKDLEKLIEEKMWSDEKQYYADVNRFTFEISNVLTPASFMPLYIGTASQERAAAMNVLVKNKNKFDCKMPTVTYDNPGFSEEYWRGPTWLNVAYFAAKGLKNYGFDSADKIKNTILMWCSEDKRGIFENYNSITGRGMYYESFSWSAAFIIEFILNF